MGRAKAGICEWVLPERGPEALRHAAALGFDGIQIAEQGGWEAGDPLLRPEVQAAYFRARGDTGIAIQALHLWSLCRMACLIHPMESEAGKLGRQCLRTGLEICRKMEIPALMVTSGFLCQIKNRKDFETFGGYLAEACRIARDMGIQVVFESALSAEETIEMCGRAEGLKICYDLFNPIRFALGDPLEQIPRLGFARIDHFHVKDGPANMVGCTLLGRGAGGWEAAAALLRQNGYEGWLVSENYYGAPPISWELPFDEAAPRDLAAMRSV